MIAHDTQVEFDNFGTVCKCDILSSNDSLFLQGHMFAIQMFSYDCLVSSHLKRAFTRVPLLMLTEHNDTKSSQFG